MTFYRNKKYQLTSKMIQVLQHLAFRQENPDRPTEENPHPFNRASVKALYTRRLVSMPDLELTSRGQKAVQEIQGDNYDD